MNEEDQAVADATELKRIAEEQARAAAQSKVEEAARKAADKRQAQLDAWFTYHPPTDDQAPKYAAISGARAEASAIILSEGSGRAAPNYEKVNACLRRFAEVILDNAPASADTTAAVRCVRLARNAANALLREPGNGQLQASALQNLYAAQWQANAAIALEGK